MFEKESNFKNTKEYSEYRDSILNAIEIERRKNFSWQLLPIYPCPFCGSRCGTFGCDPHGNLTEKSDPVKNSWVHCFKCGYRSPKNVGITNAINQHNDLCIALGLKGKPVSSLATHSECQELGYDVDGSPLLTKNNH